MKDSLVKLITQYNDTQDKSLLPDILKESGLIVRSWVTRYTKMKEADVLDDFSQNIAMDFLYKIICGKVVDNHITILLNLARSRFSNCKEEIDAEHEPSPREHMLSGESFDCVKNQLDSIYKEQKYFFMYAFIFPRRWDELRTLIGNDKVYYSIMVKVLESRRKIRRQVDEPETLPKNVLGNILLLESLFNKHPALFVLFNLFKDVDKFLQFCKLFENEEVSLPSFSEIERLVTDSNKLAENSSSNTMDDGDIRLLRSFVMQNLKRSDSSVLSENLDSFCNGAIETLVDNYDRAQKKLLEGIDSSHTYQLQRFLKLLQSELNSQINLYLKMAESMQEIIRESSLHQ